MWFNKYLDVHFRFGTLFDSVAEICLAKSAFMKHSFSAKHCRQREAYLKDASLRKRRNRQDSNTRPLDCHACALPLCYSLFYWNLLFGKCEVFGFSPTFFCIDHDNLQKSLSHRGQKSISILAAMRSSDRSILHELKSI